MLSFLLQIHRSSSKTRKDQGHSKPSEGKIALDDPKTHDIILRSGDEVAYEKTTGIFELYRMHKEAEEKEKEAIAASRSNSHGHSSSSNSPSSNGSPGGRRPSRLAAITGRRDTRGNTTGRSKSSAGRKGSIMPGKSGHRAPPAFLTKKSHPHFHILVDFKQAIISVGEDMDLYFSIYSSTEGRIITEEFPVNLNPMGIPHDRSQLYLMRTFFKDQSYSECAEGKLYLICRVYRQGPLQYEENKDKEARKYKGKTPRLRRPLGVAVTPLSQITSDVHFDTTMTLMVPKEEREFSHLHKNIIKESGGFEPLPKAKGISVALHAYTTEWSSLKKSNPDFASFVQTNKIDFPEIIAANESRHDLYLTLRAGEFAGDIPHKQVQIRVAVFLNQGEDVPKAISVGGEKPRDSYESAVFYNDRGPQYGETVRVSISHDLYNKAHVLIAYHAVSSRTSTPDKAFAYSFLRLIDINDGTAIKDGNVALPIYKCAELPRHPDIYLNPGSKLQAAKHVLQVSVRLRSTKLTQNPYLMRLLNWKQDTGDISEILKRVTFIDQFEIVKQLREVFDALFSILAERADEAAFLVFDAVVFVIGLLVDDKTNKFANFHPVLDQYIEKEFSGTTAHSSLVSCLKFYLRKADSSGHAVNIRASIKALEYLFKFIITSRLLYDRRHDKESRKGAAFKNEILDLLGALNDVMKLASPDWVIGAQTLALKHFASIFTDLAKIFRSKELSQIAIDFIGSVRVSEKKQVTLEKLAMLRRLAGSGLFSDDQARAAVLPTFAEQIKIHFKRGGDEASNAVHIIAEMLDQAQSQRSSSLVADVAGMIPLLLQSLLSTFKDPRSDGRSEATTTFLGIFSIMKQKHYDAVLDGRPSRTQFLADTFKVANNALNDPIFPANWTMMRMFQFSSTLRLLRHYGSVVKNQYSSSKSFSHSLFDNYFRAAVGVASADLLQFERLPSQKKSFLEKRYGDMRKDAADLLKAAWDSLSKEQGSFIPSMVGPFLEVAKNTNKDVAVIGVLLYGSLLEREFRESGSFQKVARRTFDALDRIISVGQADPAFREILVTNLTARIKKNSALSKKGSSFVNDLNQLIGFMMALRSCPATQEFEDERTLAMLKLMTYLKKTDRMDLYVVYVDKLKNLHLSLSNYTEAGLTLLLYANLLQWSDEPIAAQGPHPSEPARVRKEKLMLQAIEYFDKAKTWERGIALIRDLRSYYEERNSPRLQEARDRETQFLELIMERGANRFFAEYFRVAYYGRGLPKSYQNKEFVYRGKELEKLADFIARIGRKFPKAEVLSLQQRGPPPKEIVKGPGQYIQVTRLSPSSREQMKGGQRKIDDRLPQAVQKYVQLNDVNIFSYSRAFVKAKHKVSPDDAVKYTWAAVTYLVTQDTFPSYLRRSEIIDSVERELSPVEIALQTLTDKNKELTSVIAIHEKEADEGTGDGNISRFTMLLKGVIDAAIGGGTRKYKDAFFTRSYMDKNPEKLPILDSVRAALKEQLSILQRALMVHRRLCSDEMLPLQDQLETFFTKLKQEFQPVIKGEY